MRRTDPDAEDKAYDQMRQREMDGEGLVHIPRVQGERTPYAILADNVYAGVISADRITRRYSQIVPGYVSISAYADGWLLYSGVNVFLTCTLAPERIPCF